MMRWLTVSTRSTVPRTSLMRCSYGSFRGVLEPPPKMSPTPDEPHPERMAAVASAVRTLVDRIILFIVLPPVVLHSPTRQENIAGPMPTPKAARNGGRELSRRGGEHRRARRPGRSGRSRAVLSSGREINRSSRPLLLDLAHLRGDLLPAVEQSRQLGLLGQGLAVHVRREGAARGEHEELDSPRLGKELSVGRAHPGESLLGQRDELLGGLADVLVGATTLHATAGLVVQAGVAIGKAGQGHHRVGDPHVHHGSIGLALTAAAQAYAVWTRLSRPPPPAAWST